MANKLIFANNAQSSLAGSISNTATVVNLQSGTGVLFPTPGPGQYFVGTFTDAATGLDTEIVWVTNKVGDTLTIIRAQEGTTGQNWSANDLFAELWTAGQAQALLQVVDAQSQSANYAVDTGSVNSVLCALNPAITVPVPGMPIRVLIANTNTGPSTLNPGSGASAIVRRDGSALAGGELTAGDIVEFKWDGTQYRIPGVAPATPAQITSGSDTESAVTPAQLAAAVNSLPTGALAPYAGPTAPSGWLLAAGQVISRTTYAGLFSVIGVAFGVGDGSTTFGIPDLRGRVVAAADNMNGTAANRLGSNLTDGIVAPAALAAVGGSQSHVMTLTELVAHHHTMNAVSGSNAGSTGGPVQGSGATANTSDTGGSGAFNIIQPTIVLNYIIKT